MMDEWYLYEVVGILKCLIVRQHSLMFYLKISNDTGAFYKDEVWWISKLSWLKKEISEWYIDSISFPYQSNAQKLTWFFKVQCSSTFIKSVTLLIHFEWYYVICTKKLQTIVSCMFLHTFSPIIIFMGTFTM